MPHHCCVPLCTSDSRLSQCKDISFHCFPKDEDMKKKWILNIKRDIGENFRLNKETRVCSLHFVESSYHPHSISMIRKKLKKCAVPSVFQWQTPKPPRRKLFKATTTPGPTPKSSVRKLPVTPVYVHDHTYFGPERTRDLSVNDSFVEENVVDSAELNTSVHNKSTSTDDSLLDIEANPSPDKAAMFQRNLTLLGLRSEEKFTLLRFVNSDTDIRYYTGFQSFVSLSSFFQFLQPECNFLYYVGTENTSAGKGYNTISKRGPSRTLSPMEEFFITLVRLRKGLPEKLIGDLYNLSEGHVSKIINTWIIFLYDRLKCLPIWPSQDHVKQTMPSEFKLDYPDTRVIIDCTEIFIEQPSAASCQRETFSSYKHHNTAKGLIGISPQGQITFISNLYAGRCSDKKIVRHCGLLDMLDQGDSVMADKGFDIEEDLEQRGFKLTIPPFLKDQGQFTDQQLTSTRNIAAVRVHVERAVRKIKEFTILSNTVPISLCPMLDKIWVVCGHLANFTGSLFKN